MSLNRTIWLKNGITRDEHRFSERTIFFRTNDGRTTWIVMQKQKKITKGTVRKRTNWMENER